MSRLTHAFVTLIDTSFAPGFRTAVASTRYGACQTIPRDLPLTTTSARFLTSPKSSQTCESSQPYIAPGDSNVGPTPTQVCRLLRLETVFSALSRYSTGFFPLQVCRGAN